MTDAGEAGARQPLANAPGPQVMPTYDGSGEAVHPDVSYFPRGWHGWNYWLVLTPYPRSDADKENPSILVSHDGVIWQDPPGIVNPIVLPQVSFLADGDLFYDQTLDELWVYYVHQRINGHTHAMRKASADGTHWGLWNTEPGQSLFAVPDHEFLSPSVVKVGATYWLWSVNAGPVGCHAESTTIQYRTSADGICWSAPQDADFAQPGQLPWHVDVIYVPSKHEFWMLLSGMPQGSSCNETALYFARSADGMQWTTYDRAALSVGAGAAWDRGQIYRSTLLYDADKDLLRVWYSANDGSAWHVGYTEREYAEFLSLLVG
jgi:hypothetical protein